MLQYFEKFLPLVESLCCALQDEVYIMGCGAAGGPVTSSNVAAILAAILDFTKIEHLTGTYDVISRKHSNRCSPILF